jgi:hypothetical protein
LGKYKIFELETVRQNPNHNCGKYNTRIIIFYDTAKERALVLTQCARCDFPDDTVRNISLNHGSSTLITGLRNDMQVVVLDGALREIHTQVVKMFGISHCIFQIETDNFFNSFKRYSYYSNDAVGIDEIIF